MKTYLALFRNNMRLTMRDRGVLFFNFLFPFIFFFAFAELFHAGTGEGIAYFVATVLVMGILGNGLWGAGMRVRTGARDEHPAPLQGDPDFAAAAAGGIHGERVAALHSRAGGVVGVGAFHVRDAHAAKYWLSLFVLCSLGVCAFRAIGLILASVTNTMQEATILIQILYMPMLFLSGATIPAAILPIWAQTLRTVHSRVLPGAGFPGHLLPQPHIWRIRTTPLPWPRCFSHWCSASFSRCSSFAGKRARRFPRATSCGCWPCSRRLSVMGCYQAYSKENIGKNEALLRDLQRSGLILIRNARIFTGDGKIIENGSVLVRDGKIDGVYEQGAAPDPEKIRADVVEGAGKTLLPGLIDVHVHLTSSGGMFGSSDDFDENKAMLAFGRRAAL